MSPSLQRSHARSSGKAGGACLFSVCIELQEFYTQFHVILYNVAVLNVFCYVPYTRVNKRIRLFLQLQENMPLIMRGKNWPHPQNCDASLVACVHDSVFGR